MPPVNMHATALVLGRAGLLVTGRSGAGKSALATALLDLVRANGCFGVLVGDDQLWLRVAGNRLVAEAPATIGGLIELRGFGPAPVPFLGAAVIDGVVALVDPASAPRHREEERQTLLGIALPRLDLAERGLPGSAAAAHAWLATLQNA